MLSFMNMGTLSKTIKFLGLGTCKTQSHTVQSKAMGEGFGDILACVYFADRGGGYQKEVFGDWVFAPGGLRRVDGTKKYPGDWAMRNMTMEKSGLLALWNIYRAIGGDSASARNGRRQEALFSKPSSLAMIVLLSTHPCLMALKR